MIDNQSLALGITIQECVTKEEINSTYAVMQQLRPHIKQEDYYDQVNALIQKEYFCLLAAYDQHHRCIGAVGFQKLNRLSLGKIIYIADLVVDEKLRSHKIGYQLLEKVKEIAKENAVDAIVLESGAQRKKAHQFYERNGYKFESHSFRLYKPFTNTLQEQSTSLAQPRSRL